MSHAASASDLHPLAAPAADQHPHSVAHAVGHCLNCRQRLAGPHCHRCGQPASTPARITGHYLLHDIPHSVWHVDHGVIYTVREMLLRPGITIQRYLAGERQPFFRPLSLLLLVGGIGAFLYSVFNIELFNEQQPGVTAQVAKAQREMMHMLQKYQTWLSIFILPISATVATPLLRRRTGYTWPEQLVAAALMNGALAAANLLFIPLMVYWSGKPGIGYVAMVMTGVMLMYKTWSYAQLQAQTTNPARPVGRWLRGFFIAIADYFCTLLVIGGLLLAVLLNR